MYEYKAEVVKVYDGDTITVNIDLGLGIWLKDQKIRLFGINAPELRGKNKEEGKKSRDYLSDLLTGKEIILDTIKDKKGKYGRWLGIIHTKDYTISINEIMVQDKYAEKKDY